jgi:hypothetical protein
MSESMQRMVDLMREDGIKNKAELARRTGFTPQMIGNWKASGVSREAALQLEERFGWRALYILHGSLPARDADSILDSAQQVVLTHDPDIDADIMVVRLAPP